VSIKTVKNSKTQTHTRTDIFGKLMCVCVCVCVCIYIYIFVFMPYDLIATNVHSARQSSTPTTTQVKLKFVCLDVYILTLTSTYVTKSPYEIRNKLCGTIFG
jgi:uncharacterized membrane protein